MNKLESQPRWLCVSRGLKASGCGVKLWRDLASDATSDAVRQLSLLDKNDRTTRKSVVPRNVVLLTVVASAVA